MKFKPQPLKNDLVSLVPLNESDFERLFLVASDPQIWEQHPTKDRYKREVFKLYFDGALASESIPIKARKKLLKILFRMQTF